MPRLRSFGFLVVLIVTGVSLAGVIEAFSGSSRSNGAHPNSTVVPSSCPVTRPQDAPFVPPFSIFGDLKGERFWFGSERLWTILDKDGRWHGLRAAKGYGDKFFLFSTDFEDRKTSGLRVAITGRKREAIAPSFAQYGICCSSDVSGRYSFIVAGIDIPTSGCWEITADKQGEKLTFVVWVAPTDPSYSHGPL